MKLCIVADRYPTDDYPINTFLDKLICEMAEQGNECTVIAPFKPIIDKLKRINYNPPFYRERITASGNVIKIYHPTYFSLSNKPIAGINMAKIGLRKYVKCIDTVIQKQKLEFDAIYGHFILHAGFAAAEIGRKYNRPSFLAYGESSYSIVGNYFSEDEVRQKLQSIAGVVAVSSKNRDELLEHSAVDAEKIRVFPNAIDNNAFRVMDKYAIREKLGITRDDFVVAFVGHFINRKGSKRVSAALERFDDVKSIFIGAGPDEPTCGNIIHKGRLPHDKIPEYLNAADVFVLPTLAEGCCNAIVEAMACGLPIISSNLAFNDDILDASNSIRVDPMDIDEIAAAIRTLKDDVQQRKEMAEASIALAANLTIDKRANRIVSFIEESRNICICRADKEK